MKIAVIGSRGFKRLDLVRQFVEQLPDSTIVISGGARGVDYEAETAALERGLEVRVFRADWKTHGRAAGPIRNTLIIEAADRVVAFWDQSSPGTADAIRKARALGKDVEVRIAP